MANNKKKKIESFDQLAEMQQHKRPEASKEEPAISNMLDEFEIWMATNWKKVIIGVCAFAVVVSIVIIIQGLIRSADEKARRELANANTGDIAQREAIVSKHASHEATNYTRLMLAEDLIRSQKPEDLTKAREYLLAVANSPKAEHFVRIRAALDAASISETLGQKEDAAKEFETIANRSQTTPEDLRVEAAYSAARIFASLDQNMKADAMLKLIDLDVSKPGLSETYVFWASLAKFLNEKIHPSTVSITVAEDPADAPAEEAQAPAEDAAQPAADAQAPAEDVTIQPVL